MAHAHSYDNRRAAGRYRVTDSLACVPFAGAAFWLPFNFASFARLRAFLMRQCRWMAAATLSSQSTSAKLLGKQVSRIMFHAISLRMAQWLEQPRPRPAGAMLCLPMPNALATFSFVIVAPNLSSDWIFNGESVVIHFPWLK